MIASEYLDFRNRLDAVLGALADAARRSGAEVAAGRPAVLRNLANALRDPFLIVVAGESGSGKSTFLNALAGEEFCEPVEGAIAYFKFAEQARELPGGSGLIEVYRPSTFLKNFHIAEFPGSDVATRETTDAVERFVPMADLVLTVISVADAWRPGAWKSLDRVRLGHGKDPLIVLTNCDTRSEDEIRAVVEHMGLTMDKRYSEQLSIFQVSGENAFLGRTNPAVAGEGKLESSGILGFEKFVSSQLLADDARMRKFSNAITGAQSVLEELKEAFCRDRGDSRKGRRPSGRSKGENQHPLRGDEPPDPR